MPKTKQREQIYLGNKQVPFLFLSFFFLQIHFNYCNTNLANCHDLKENILKLRLKDHQEEPIFLINGDQITQLIYNFKSILSKYNFLNDYSF